MAELFEQGPPQPGQTVLPDENGGEPAEDGEPPENGDDGEEEEDEEANAALAKA